MTDVLLHDNGCPRSGFGESGSRVEHQTETTGCIVITLDDGHSSSIGKVDGNEDPLFT